MLIMSHQFSFELLGKKGINDVTCYGVKLCMGFDVDWTICLVL